ncbi:MAG: DUF4302 domain-containing protein [Capnocytophaga sp.]|nr:DUF4302 domain-containing protein [Capnocytophaga sp.]
MKNTLYFLSFLLSFFYVSCNKDKNAFEQSPSERTAENLRTLRSELTDAPYGWRVMYFPNTDSLLFSDKNQIIEKMGDYRSLYGFGGFYFLMKFDQNGTVEMLSDKDQTALATSQKSQFEVNQSTLTELSFTTYNYLQDLVNDQFKGKNDFLYVRKDFSGNLLFKTNSSIEPARNFIVFQKLTNATQWNGENNQKNDITLAYENRKFFEEMQNPQLVIKKGSRIFFKSDVFIKTNSPLESYQKFLQEIKEKRYYLFRFNKKRNEDPNIYQPEESTGLGSGYVGTEKGITFHAGLRYDSTYIFYDFQRVGNKFVCELVKVYDPIRKRYYYESKHLFPDGEPTFFTAEITDEPKPF